MLRSIKIFIHALQVPTCSIPIAFLFAAASVAATRISPSAARAACSCRQPLQPGVKISQTATSQLRIRSHLCFCSGHAVLRHLHTRSSQRRALVRSPKQGGGGRGFTEAPTPLSTTLLLTLAFLLSIATDARFSFASNRKSKIDFNQLESAHSGTMCCLQEQCTCSSFLAADSASFASCQKIKVRNSVVFCLFKI